MEHCQRFIGLISQSLDQALSSQDQQALDQHLAECLQCRELAWQLKQLQQELDRWPEQEVPEGFAEGVMQRVRAAAPAQKTIPLWKRPQVRALGSLAACALLCVGLVRFGLGRPDKSAVLSRSASVPTVIAADGESAAAPQALEESLDSSGYPASVSGQTLPTPAAPEDEAILQKESDLSALSSGSEAIFPSDSAAGDSTLYDPLPGTYSIESRSTSSDPFSCGELLRSVAEALGEEPGALLVTEAIPPELEDMGVWYATQEGRSILVLENAPEDELYQTLVQNALLFLEEGEGAFALLLWSE